MRRITRLVPALRSTLTGAILALLLSGAAVAQQDTTPPVLLDFDFAPKVVDVSEGPVSVTIVWHVSDDISGVIIKSAQVHSPSGIGQKVANGVLVSGDALNGVYTATLTFQTYDERGVWPVFQVQVRDAANNVRYLSDSELAAAGFPSTITVVSSGNSDADGDGISDLSDNCPVIPNMDQADGDYDLIGDACDSFPDDRDNEQAQCEADLSQCQVDIGTCPADLGACQTDLAQCTTDLSDSEASLVTCQGDLTACTTEALPQCEGDLSICQGALTASEGQRIQCGFDLSACAADLSGTQTNLTTCTINLGSCQVDLQATQNALDTSNAALATCTGDLSTCQANLLLQDADGDGTPDPLDRCPGTAPASDVDDSGCAQPQFCAQFDATTRDGAKACKKADWKNDEPLMKPAKEADCAVDKGLAGTEDDTCVPAQAE